MVACPKKPLLPVKVFSHTLWQSLCVTLLAFALSYTLAYDISSLSVLSSVEETADVALSDIYNVVAERRAVSRISDEVVLVGIDRCTRKEIAVVLEAVDWCEPKAVGLDVFFLHPSHEDATLLAALQNCRNLVLPTRVVYAEDCGQFVVSEESCFDAMLPDKARGVVNLAADYVYQMVREFKTSFLLTDGSTLDNFVVALAHCANPELYARFVERDTEAEIIRYPSIEFETLTAEELLDAEGFPTLEAEALLQGRVVLVGALQDPADFHLTPIQPQMSGLRIHACALQTILSESYIRRIPEWIGWLLAVLFCFLFSWLNMFIKQDARWNNIEALGLRVVQMGLMYGFLVVGCWWFIRHDGYIDFSASLLMIGLSAVASDVWMGLCDIVRLVAYKYRQWILKVKKTNEA